jgi:hypothetical protein
MAKASKGCHHPLNDNCIMTFTLVAKDYVFGTESLTYSYRCGDHGRYGSFSVKTSIRIPEEIRDWMAVVAKDDPPPDTGRWGA